MQLIEFQKKLSMYPIFSLRDVQKIAPNFYRIQLDRWQKKGYIKRIKKEYYYFTDKEIDQNFLFYLSNKIYSPSYISLEKAFQYYDFIPEEIFQITSVSSKKTTKFTTSLGNFSYRHIKPSIFFGYRMIDYGKQKILLAESEKAVLDYLYLNPRLKAADDFREMRINKQEFLEKIDFTKLQRYLKAFENKSLSSRVKTFLNTVKND
jgi:predicted transcriptional regulator of viral defense system